MYYSEDLVEEVRSRNDVVDVIGGYVKLTKKGSTWFGLCPFHNEKTGSFSVSRNKQMYYCFGCHKGGSVFTFVMEYENFTYPEAIEFLAERAGVPLPVKELTDEQRRENSKRQQLLDIHKEAAKYFYTQLKGKNGFAAQDYFKKRQLEASTINHFGLGYANPFRDDLYQYLKKKGYKDLILKESGLITFDEKYGAHDKFWNRVMFPIMDINNKVIAFGGRVIGDGNPKYLNSPETLIFNKRRHLYGLNYARSSREKFMILCEGYMDVIAMHQAGFTNAIASLGTAFTEQHGAVIKRYTDEIYLAYDSDGAGVSAAMRAISMLRSVGISTKVIHMDPYKDPDEFIKALGTDAFKERIERAENGFMFQTSVVSRDFDLTDPDGRVRFYNAIAERLLEFEQKIERDSYIESVARRYGISNEDLKKLVNKKGLIAIRRSEQDQNRYHRIRDNEAQEIALSEIDVQDPRQQDESTGNAVVVPKQVLSSQKLLLGWIATEPSLIRIISKYITADEFVHPVYKQVAEAVFKDAKSGRLIAGQIINRFEDKDAQAFAAGIFQSPVALMDDQNDREKALTETIVRIKRFALDQLMKQEKDPSGLMKLIQEKNDLAKLAVRL